MTTLAVATTEHLLLSATASLKRTSSLLSSNPKISIPRPLAGTWSSDNSTLFLVFSDGIRKYSDRGATEDNIFSSSDEELQACVVAKDNGTIICALSNRIAMLESTPSSNDYTIVRTIDVHTSPVTSLAISNDGVVLASTSQTTVHIHSLESGSHTVLRGLPQSSEEPSLCTFSPHFRKKLIVGSGQVLYVYDITRPSSPSRTIPLGSSANGDVVSLVCSPYSKTLVAVACEGGTVHLVDLEKGKGLFRMVDVKTRVTSLVFSPEGAAMYIGTDAGNLLVVDLRSLDKPPKSVSASGIGSRIECLVVQAKSLTPTSSASSKQPLRKPLVQRDQNTKATPQRRSSSQPVSTKSPISALSAKSKESPVPTPVRKRTVSGVIRSPSVKSPPVIRRSASTLSNIPSSKTAPPKPKVFSPQPRKPSTTTTAAKTPKKTADTETEPPKEVRKVTKPLTKGTSKSPLLPKARPTGEPVRRVVSADTTGTKAASRRPFPTVPSISIVTSRKPKPPSVTSSPSSGKQSDQLSVSAASSSKLRTSTASSSRKSTTPSTSPELHVRALPITPFKGKISGPVFSLQFTDDEDEDWDVDITTKQPARQQVGFEVVSDAEEGKIEELDDQKDNNNEVSSVSPRKKETTLQVTPARPGVQRHSGAWPPVPSPLRRGLEDMQHTGDAPSSITNVHSMLQQIMRDVMYDYQEDMRTELVGMHLDMVRMGRNWKKEMKEIMDAYAKDLRELREENRLLREENERLKRGY
ncbi:WD40 repeat-like protein [Thelephora ganbajun]|uniref:WD40 repeat-like protein n=1 Tax=Thelephora ganbajun TaxID=370292 RepID=A0ACB6ZTU8_THEGA|nr:WD40 repeat-like protein [Thelephora ganbajun]